MPDYKKMYHTLFHEMSRTIERLQRAQAEAEEIYIEADEDELPGYPTDVPKPNP